jgi:hypothetical protein
MSDLRYEQDSGGCAGASAQAQLSLSVIASDPRADTTFVVEGTVTNTAMPGQSTLPGGGVIDTLSHGLISTSATPDADVLTRAGMETVPFSLAGDAGASVSLDILAQAIANTSCLAGPFTSTLTAESLITFTLRIAPVGATTTSSSSTTSTSSTSTTTETSATSTTSTSTTVPGGVRDPYRVYAATGPDAPSVTLTDEFGTETVDLGSVFFFLPPAGIDGVPFLDQTIAQVCYDHSGALFSGTADVVHRLGSQTLQLGDPVALCVPSEATGIAVNPYACYAAAGDSLAQPHTLADDFQLQAVEVLEPFLFCVPVAVDGAGVVNPFEYLACYLTEPAGTPAGSVGITNVFHSDTLAVGGPVGLCVPLLEIPSVGP